MNVANECYEWQFNKKNEKIWWDFSSAARWWDDLSLVFGILIGDRLVQWCYLFLIFGVTRYNTDLSWNRSPMHFGAIRHSQLGKRHQVKFEWLKPSCCQTVTHYIGSLHIFETLCSGNAVVECFFSNVSSPHCFVLNPLAKWMRMNEAKLHLTSNWHEDSG